MADAAPLKISDERPDALTEALAIRDEMIAVARALSSRDCGALQSEMRLAQGEYLVGVIASLRGETGGGK